MKISFLKESGNALVDILLYSWAIAFLSCYVFVSQLTPKLMYFVHRGALDIAMDFLFILLVWAAVFLACLLVRGLIKERYQFIILWSAAVLALVNFTVNSKYAKALIGTEGEEGGPMTAQLPDWFMRASGWFNSIPSWAMSALVCVLIAAATALLYLAASKYRQQVLVFAAVMAAVLALNLVWRNNTRFVHDAPDASLFDYKIKSVAASANGKKLPQTVHIIVLDSFPYEKMMMEKGSPESSKYKNFSALLSQSHVFHNARSAGGGTEETFPKMLTGLNGEISYKNSEAYIKSDDGRTALSSAPSIFSLAKRSGDKAYITGYFHEYCHLFRASTDGCSDYSFHGVFSDFADDSLGGELSLRWKVFARHLGLFRSSGPDRGGDFPLLYDGGNKFMDPKLWASLFKSLTIDYQNFMVKNDDNALFLTHLNIPHIPIVFDSNGEFVGQQSGGNTTSRYHDELLYIDTVLGAIIEDIKKTSDYDKSLIIVTADHGFRGDEIQGAKYDERHIPFIVKAPGQKERKDTDMAFDTIDLMDVLENYYKGRASGRYELLENIKPSGGGDPGTMEPPPMDEEQIRRQEREMMERERLMRQPPETRLEPMPKPKQ
jgi:hypothetical protein